MLSVYDITETRDTTLPRTRLRLTRSPSLMKLTFKESHIIIKNKKPQQIITDSHNAMKEAKKMFYIIKKEGLFYFTYYFF